MGIRHLTPIAPSFSTGARDQSTGGHDSVRRLGNEVSISFPFPFLHLGSHEPGLFRQLGAMFLVLYETVHYDNLLVSPKLICPLSSSSHGTGGEEPN